MLRLQDLTLELGSKDPSVLPGIDQAYAYLAKRGIPYEMIDKLGLMLVRAGPLLERIKGRGGIVDSRIAIIIPHPDKLGGVRDWWSCRLVDTMGALGSRGFASLVQGTRAKMLCPPGERPEAYFTPNIEWNPQDGDYIYFHESAIKAINGAALGLYSAFQAWSCFAIWQHVYDCQDHFIEFMSVPVNLKHWLLAAQVNVAIIAIRFAVRALSDERNLMFCPGLIRVRLPEAEVLKLKDIMQASSW